MDSLPTPKNAHCRVEKVKMNGIIFFTTRPDFDDALKFTAFDRPGPPKQPDVEKGLSKLDPAQERSRFSRSNTIGYLEGVRDYFDFVVFTTYRQLWAIVVAANLIGIIVVLTEHAGSQILPLASCANAAVANLLGGILVRQDYMKNIMFHACWSIPHSAPLWLRRRLALVYENGGVHSGAGVSAMLWFAIFTGFLETNFARHAFTDAAVLCFDCMLTVVLLYIILTAVPQLRRKHHNVFENAHRWAGWFGIALFWVALVLFARDEAQSFGAGRTIGGSLVKLPAFWMLTIISLHAIYPWLLLRKIPVVRSERLTDHAIRLYFDPKEKIPPKHGMAISDAPLWEWHGFAAIPALDARDDGLVSCIISKAGDWTAKTVESPAPYYYMRGIHATGVLSMAQVFHTVIVMATGSGIGPCLAAFGQFPRTKLHIIWSAPSPRKVFGDAIYDAVLQQGPGALIWDTRKDGRRPDMVELAAKRYEEVGAEAVFFISNRNLTRKVVASLRKRKVAAYAPVFDS